MSLPNLPAGDKFRREVRTEWGGLNLNESASDGELVEAVNMSSREFPVLSTERLNLKFTDTTTTLIAPYLVDGALGYIKKIGTDYYKLYDPTTGGGWKTISLTDAQADKVQYGYLGNRIVIWPSKQVYDFSTQTVSDLGASLTLSNHPTIDHLQKNGVTINDVLYDEGTPPQVSPFSVGDALTISGWEAHPENNKTAILRKIENGAYYVLNFDADIFDTTVLEHKVAGSALPAGTYNFKDPQTGKYHQFTTTVSLAVGVIIHYDGDGASVVTLRHGPDLSFAVTDGSGGSGLTFVSDPDGDYHGAASVAVARVIPDMDYICVNENRVWGCKGDTIYASKLGDPTNWNVFDGLSTDSWATETGTDGEFTGCCSYQGYPTFFKEGAVFKVLGDEPKNFVLRKLNVVGVKDKASKTIVEIAGRLYYLSSIGVVQWNGGDYPTVVSHAIAPLPGMFTDTANSVAVAGTDGVRYIIEAAFTRWKYDDQEVKSINSCRTFAYDPRFNTWHELAGINDRDLGTLAFANDGFHAYMLAYTDAETYEVKPTTNAPTDVYLLSEPADKPKGLDWSVTFADSTRAFKTALTGSESKKGTLRLLIRCRLSDVWKESQTKYVPGTMKVWIAYDGGEFEEAAEFTAMEKNSKVVPLILRRCDFWQLRLTGTGDAVIYSIAVERYGGEWQQA